MAVNINLCMIRLASLVRSCVQKRRDHAEV